MKFLLFFHGSSLNRGAEAIIRTAAQLIKQEYPDATIDLASNFPETDHIIPNIDNVFLDKNREIKRYSFNWFISVLKLKFFKDESFAFRKIRKDIIKRISKYDIFLSTGGDNYCYGEQPGIYEIDKQIKKRNKKLILWGASIGPEDLSTPKINDLKHFDLILARESYTYKTLLEAGIKNVIQIADGAFIMQKEELALPDSWDKSNNTIGFNYSPLVYKMNQSSKEAAFKLIDHILKTTDLNIVFTPHVTLEGNNDYEVLKEFQSKYEKTGRTILLPNNLNAPQYKGYISRMRFFIGARTHATIAAYSSLVPTMVLGYSVKSKGIAFDLFDEEKLVLNLNEISDEKILIDKFNELISDEKVIRDKLSKRVPIIQAKAKEAIKYIKQIAE